MLNNQPLVSIILVNYNGLNDTIDCIKSLNNINYKNYNVIIVDNASKDNSVEVLKEKYSNEDKIKLIFLNKNIGFAGGNNVGIKLAMDNGSKYVLLLNNDTVVDENFLDALVNRAEKVENVGVVGGKIYYYDNKNMIWYAGAKINKFNGKTTHVGVDEYDDGKYDVVSEPDYVTGCLMLVPTDVIRKEGFMDESYFLYYEETDWCVRIKNAGYKLIYEPKSVIYHKVSSSTKKISHIMDYYYNRNSYQFVFRNYGIFSKISMFFYKRLYLLLKYLKSKKEKNNEKADFIVKAYKSIKSKEMGKYNG